MSVPTHPVSKKEAHYLRTCGFWFVTGTAARETSNYRDLDERTHNERESLYAMTVETIKSLLEWAAVSLNPTITPNEKEMVLKPLAQRAALELDLPDGSAGCRVCRATVQ